jgi:hypothetical protein
MDTQLDRHGSKPTTFNSPLEAGMRTVALLMASYPHSYDMQRLIAFDYLLVHTGDVGGPDSLHPRSPYQSSEFLMRRKIVEQAVLLMMTRGLIAREDNQHGIKYKAGENANVFLSSLQSNYSKEIRARADWLSTNYGPLSDSEFNNKMRNIFDRWLVEFQAVERSLGAEA